MPAITGLVVLPTKPVPTYDPKVKFDITTYDLTGITALVVTPDATKGNLVAVPAKPTPTVVTKNLPGEPSGRPIDATLPGLYKPSETEMEAYYAPLLECPAAYVPIDLPPSKADAGSFKGYSNRWTYHSVGGEYDLDTAGKTVKYDNMSESLNMFTSSATMGCIIGFAVFGLGIMYAVVMIAVDMKRRLAMYEDLIADDVAKMSAMGL